MNRRFIDKIPKTIAWIMLGVFIVVNSAFTAERYAHHGVVVEHFTLNATMLGWTIIGTAVFGLLFNHFRFRNAYGFEAEE